MHRILVLCLAGVALALPAASFAAPAAHKAPAAVPQARKSVTHGSVVIDGQRIGYTATAGTIILKNKQGKPTASVFYVAYTKDGVHQPGNRPVTFAYNGGPGFASALVVVERARVLFRPSPQEALSARGARLVEAPT